MSKEDEDDESGNITLSRFPCMPSLVALQQMRNRLHMAYVGKKLMKWTAQATGRELRKIGFEYTKTCVHFRDEMRESYILLARARYFYPNLNNMVLEHVGKKADMTIDVKMKSITGVKVIRLEIVDNSEDSYPHLGIEKGGEAIKAAKYAWKHILKRISHMIEQRTSFKQVDEANKAATKKKNVIEKVIIPKTKQTIKFILDEMEELEREDTYRLKMFKKLKESRMRKRVEVTCTCPSHTPEGESDESVCFVCNMRFKNTPGNKLYIEHILSHIDDMVTLTKHYKLDESIPGEIERFVKSCGEIKGYIEEFARDPFVCNVCKIHDTAFCQSKDICKSAPAFDYKERDLITEEHNESSQEVKTEHSTESIRSTQACQCSYNASPNISIPALLTYDTKTSSDPILRNSVQEIITPSTLVAIDYLKELNPSQSAVCQYDECNSCDQLATNVPLSRCFYECEVIKGADADISANELSISKITTCQYNKSQCSISCQESMLKTVQIVDKYIRDCITSVSAVCQCDILTKRNAIPCQENIAAERENIDILTKEPHSSRPATCQYDNNPSPSWHEYQCQEKVEPTQFNNYMRDFTRPEAVICKCDNCESTSKYCLSNQENNMPGTNDYYKDLGSSNNNFYRSLSVYSNPWQQRTTSKDQQIKNKITDKNSLTCHCADGVISENLGQERTAPFTKNSQKEYSREYQTLLEPSTTCHCTDISKEYSTTCQTITSPEAVRTVNIRKCNTFELATHHTSNASSYDRQTKSSSDFVSRCVFPGQERATPEPRPAIDYLNNLNPSQSASCQYHDKLILRYSNSCKESTTRKPIQVNYLSEYSYIKSTSCNCSASVSTNTHITKTSSEKVASGVLAGQENATPNSGLAIDDLGESNDIKSTSCQCTESVTTSMELSRIFPGQKRATPETSPAIDYLRELNPSNSAVHQYHDKPISKYTNPWQQDTREPIKIDYLRELNNFELTSSQYHASVTTSTRPTQSSSEIVSSGVFPGQERPTPLTMIPIDYPRELNPPTATCPYKSDCSNGPLPVQRDLIELSDFKSTASQCDSACAIKFTASQCDSACAIMRLTKSCSDMESRGFVKGQENATPNSGLAIDDLGESNDIKSTSCQCTDSVTTYMELSRIFPGQKRATPETSPAIDYLRELNPSNSAVHQYHDKPISKYTNPWQQDTREPIKIDYLRELNNFELTSSQYHASVTTSTRPTQSSSEIVSSGVFPGQERPTPLTMIPIDYPRELNPPTATCPYKSDCSNGPLPVQRDLIELSDFKSTASQCDSACAIKFTASQCDSACAIMRLTKSCSDMESRGFVKGQENATPNSGLAIDDLGESNDIKSTSCQCTDSVTTYMELSRIFPGQKRATPETSPAIDYLRELNPSNSAVHQYHDKPISKYTNPWQQDTREPIKIDYLRELNNFKLTSSQYHASVTTSTRPTQSSSEIVSSGVFPGQERPTPLTMIPIDYPQELNPPTATCPYKSDCSNGPLPVQRDLIELSDFKSTASQCDSACAIKFTASQCDSACAIMRLTKSCSDMESRGFVKGQENTTSETGQAVNYPRELNISQSAPSQYHDKSTSKNSSPCQESTSREVIQIDYPRQLRDLKSISCQCSKSASTNIRSTKSSGEVVSSSFVPSQSKTAPETRPAIDYLREQNPSKSATCQYYDTSVSGYSNPLQERASPKPVKENFLRKCIECKSISCQYSDSRSIKMRPTKSCNELRPAPVPIDNIRVLDASKSTTISCQCHTSSVKPISGSFMPYQEVTTPQVVKSSSTRKSQQCHCDYSASIHFRPIQESDLQRNSIRTSDRSCPFHETKTISSFSYIFDRVVKPGGIEPHVSGLKVSTSSVLPDVAASTTNNIPPSTCKTGVCSKVASFKSVNTSLLERPCKTADSLNVDDDTLGFFEKQTKDIVKVTRGVDDNGSMIEEKKFITIRTEKRAGNKYARFNTNMMHDQKEFKECSFNKVATTREAKPQNSNVCRSKKSTPTYDSMVSPRGIVQIHPSLLATKDSISKINSNEILGSPLKFSSFHSIVPETEKTEEKPKPGAVNTLISKNEKSSNNTSDRDEKALKETFLQKSLEGCPRPCKSGEYTFQKDDATSCLPISYISKNTSTDSVSQIFSKNKLPCAKSCPSNITAPSMDTVTCLTKKCPFTLGAKTSHLVVSGIFQNTSTDNMLEKPSGKYKTCLLKNKATNYDAIFNTTEKTSTDDILLLNSVNKPTKHRSCPFSKMETTSLDSAALPTETTSMDKSHEQSIKQPMKHLCSNCKQELIKESELKKGPSRANYVLVPQARTLATQTGYKDIWVDDKIMRKTCPSSAVDNCNTKANSPIWTEVETPKSNVSITCSGKSNFKSIPSIFDAETAEYDDDEIKVIIKIIPKSQPRKTYSAGAFHSKPSQVKCGNSPTPQEAKPSTLSCPVQTQSCKLVKIRSADYCDCEKTKPYRVCAMAKSASYKTGQFSGSTKSGASSYVSCRSSAIATYKATSGQQESERLKRILVSDRTNSEEELFTCTLQKNRSNKSSCTGTSIYSAKVPASYKASRTTLRSGESAPFVNVSTVTKRSDRFDLRTLRQLQMNRKSSTHAPKKIPFTPCPCSSDPRLNKLKSKRLLKRCHSSSDGDC